MRTQADLLSTMPTAPNARVGLRSWLFALVAVAGLASAAGREVHTFERAGLTIVVASSESEFSESRAYQVVVSDALRTLSRLEVNRDGVIADAWITDLDRDGAFEIIVATDLLAGEDRGAVDSPRRRPRNSRPATAPVTAATTSSRSKMVSCGGLTPGSALPMVRGTRCQRDEWRGTATTSRPTAGSATGNEPPARRRDLFLRPLLDGVRKLAIAISNFAIVYPSNPGRLAILDSTLQV